MEGAPAVDVVVLDTQSSPCRRRQTETPAEGCFLSKMVLNCPRQSKMAFSNFNGGRGGWAAHNWAPTLGPLPLTPRKGYSGPAPKRSWTGLQMILWMAPDGLRS